MTVAVPESEHETADQTPRENGESAGGSAPKESIAQAAPMESTAQAGPDAGAQKRQRRQSTALVILAVVAVLVCVYFARPILMPVHFAIILTLLLRPIVRRCGRFRIPDFCSSAVVLTVLLAVVGTGALYLIGPAQEWANNAPRYMQVVGEKLKGLREQLQQINQASSEVRAFAEGASPEDSEDQSFLDRTIREWTGTRQSEAKLSSENGKPVPVEVRQPGLTTGLSVLTVTGSLLAGVVITLVLTYFLLATGDRLLNNVLHVLPTFRDKRRVVEMVYEVEQGVSSYLLTVTLINVALGILIGLAMWLMGVPNPALWGAMATVLNFIPYFGAMTGTCVVFLVAVFTFDSVAYACLVPVVYFALTALEGNVVTPSLLGRRMSMSPVVVFLSLIFWGWIWGVGGALIAVPTLAILKVGLDQFDRTKPLGTLLGA